MKGSKLKTKSVAGGIFNESLSYELSMESGSDSSKRVQISVSLQLPLIIADVLRSGRIVAFSTRLSVEPRSPSQKSKRTHQSTPCLTHLSGISGWFQLLLEPEGRTRSLSVPLPVYSLPLALFIFDIAPARVPLCTWWSAPPHSRSRHATVQEAVHPLAVEKRKRARYGRFVVKYRVPICTVRHGSLQSATTLSHHAGSGSQGDCRGGRFVVSSLSLPAARASTYSRCSSLAEPLGDFSARIVPKVIE